MLRCKSLLDCTNLFCLNDYKDDEIILIFLKKINLMHAYTCKMD